MIVSTVRPVAHGYSILAGLLNNTVRRMLP